MSDKVQIVCRGCEAKLAVPGTADELVNRKVRCPKCQMKFIARPELIRVVTAATVPEDSAKTAASPPKKKPLRVAEEVVDDGSDLEFLDDDEDELFAASPVSPSRGKRSSKSKRDEDDDEFDDLPTPAKKKKKKTKSKPAPVRSFGAAVCLWTLGGIVGGFVGGGLWWVIAYSTGVNVWYLSVLTGTAVGAGVRLGAAQYEGWMPATTAVFITLFAVFISKWTLNYTLYYGEMPGLNALNGAHIKAMSEEDLVAQYVMEVVAPEYRKAGKPVDHPRANDENYEDYSTKGEYHPDLWADAEKRWRAMSPADQAAFKQNLIDRDLGIDRQSLIHHVADKEIKPEFERDGKPALFTEAEMEAMEDLESEYRPEVIAEATARLDAKTPEQRAALMESIRAEHQISAKAEAGIMFFMVLLFTCLSFLWPSNLICLIIACVSAYQIGNYDGVTS